MPESWAGAPLLMRSTQITRWGSIMHIGSISASGYFNHARMVRRPDARQVMRQGLEKGTGNAARGPARHCPQPTHQIERGGRTDAPPDATSDTRPLFASLRDACSYRFLREKLGSPFSNEARLASTEALGTDYVPPSFGLYNTRVYAFIKSVPLYHMVLTTSKETNEQD